MIPTPATLPRHELIGLPVRVAAAADPGLVGIGGVVVDETTATLAIEGRREGTAGASRVFRVPKRVATFEFALTDEAADGESPPAEGARKGSGTASKLRDADGVASGVRATRPGADGEDVAHVTVDGARLHARPAERTATRGESTWR